MQKHNPADGLAVSAPKGITQKGSRARRIVGGSLIGLVVFAAGIGVGNGTIAVHAGGQSGTPSRLDYSSVNEVYQTLKSKYDGKLANQQLLDGMKAGLAESANDPYTEYFTAQQTKQFYDQLNNSFSGIGAELSQDADKNLVVVSPISGFPAATAGLKPQDIITNINGSETSGMSVDEAVNKIRGPEGSKVDLKVLRDKSQALDFTITRGKIQLPSVETKILPGSIGYMRINTFADDTSDLARQAADKFKAQKVAGVVLDLRNNPGGEVDAAVNVSSLWLPAGTTVLQQKTDGKVTKTYQSDGTATLHGTPTAVLVNGGSASASEITAGALHDNHAAQLVGEKTYGKGVVQELVNLKSGGTLKVTVASWYRPNGQNINHKGIDPDQTVKPAAGDAPQGSDAQRDAAVKLLNTAR